MTNKKDEYSHLLIEPPEDGKTVEPSQKEDEEMCAYQTDMLNTMLKHFSAFVIQDYKNLLEGKLRTEDSNYGKSYELKEEGNE